MCNACASCSLDINGLGDVERVVKDGVVYKWPLHLIGITPEPAPAATIL